VVTRKTGYEELLVRMATAGQAEFYLKARGQSLSKMRAFRDHFEEALDTVRAHIPEEFRRAHVAREDLEQFLFAEDDIVVVVGQDGLVPNTAKYLSGQPVIGVNPDPATYDGVLCRHKAADVGRLIAWAATGRGEGVMAETRVLLKAERENGESLLGLNEVFVGHRSHQSAKYTIRWEKKAERQSSSGVICATGTGCTGWARSIVQQRGLREPLPGPTDERLAWFVREPFPSVSTGTALDHGFLSRGAQLEIVSEMGEGGVIFADGIESDRMEFVTGARVTIGVSEKTLNLVVPRSAERSFSGRPVSYSARGRAPAR
jgi:NAD kinase